MAVVVGIDEAGFGPLLGPLVVSSTMFQVGDDAHTCLWDGLSAVVVREPKRGDARLAIADSKALFAGRKSLAPLERGVLIMLRAAGERVQRFSELLSRVAPECLGELREYPWYDGADFDLPLDADTGDVGTRGAPVRREIDRAGVRVLALRSRVFVEGAYNRLVGATRNKSRVLLSGVLSLVDQALRGTDDPHVRVVVDRLGGREFYRQPLMTAFPDWDMQVMIEDADRSGYRLRRGGRILDVEFAVEGERRALPTALASMLSKYVRELFMHAFNAYWSSLVPDLKPTAGYYTDAQRFLRDVDRTLTRLNIDRRRLVRER